VPRIRERVEGRRSKGREGACEFGSDYEQQPVLVGCDCARWRCPPPLPLSLLVVVGGEASADRVEPWMDTRGLVLLWFWLSTDGCIMHGYGGISEEARTERRGQGTDELSPAGHAHGTEWVSRRL
jgi:hypothetical protein